MYSKTLQLRFRTAHFNSFQNLMTSFTTSQKIKLIEIICYHIHILTKGSICIRVYRVFMCSLHLHVLNESDEDVKILLKCWSYCNPLYVVSTVTIIKEHKMQVLNVNCFLLALLLHLSIRNWVQRGQYNLKHRDSNLYIMNYLIQAIYNIWLRFS
jgi:hypothetical protein